MSRDANHDAVQTNLPPTDSDLQDWSYADPVDFQYAGFARRLAAFAIDFVVFTALQIAIGVPSLLFIEWFTNASESTVDRILMIVCILVWWLYYAFMESSAHQATLGKKLLGIKVVDLYGNRIGFWRETVRNLAKAISSLFLFLGFMIIDFTKYKQGMHDMMARTLVLKKPVKLLPAGE
jgi:uncharacterized RDD family membrane protein YckC